MTVSVFIKVEASRPAEAKPLRERSVGALLVALPGAFAETLSRQIRDAGKSAEIAEDSRTLEVELRPALIITNLDSPDGLESIRALRHVYEAPDIVAITNAPCVVRIAQAVRCGASVVLARPTTFGQITAALGNPDAGAPVADPMSLDRAIWEFLNQAVLEAGSISGAARLLRLDRTSLKRMLRKVPSS